MRVEGWRVAPAALNCMSVERGSGGQEVMVWMHHCVFRSTHQSLAVAEWEVLHIDNRCNRRDFLELIQNTRIYRLNAIHSIYIEQSTGK